jgi:phage baseplate assembly protein W
MDIKLDENNDRAIDDEFISDDEELAQAVKITLATNLGELEWNREFGLSHQDILDNTENHDYVLKQIEDCLTTHFDNFENVKIISIQPRTEDRLLDVRLEITMADGEVVNVDTNINDDKEV